MVGRRRHGSLGPAWASTTVKALQISLHPPHFLPACIGTLGWHNMSSCLGQYRTGRGPSYSYQVGRSRVLNCCIENHFGCSSFAFNTQSSTSPVIHDSIPITLACRASFYLLSTSGKDLSIGIRCLSSWPILPYTVGKHKPPALG